MGLGGHLTWTATAREICKRLPGGKVLPVKNLNGNMQLVKCPTFKNNPFIIQDSTLGADIVFPMFLDNPNANYCKQDTFQKAFHNGSKHIIEQCCEVYGIMDPELKCDMFFDEKENLEITDMCKNLPKDFLTIEPFSKTNYTPNRSYPFEKFQMIVDDLARDITVVQVGNPEGRALQNAIDLRGRTTFRTATGIIGRSKHFISCEGGLVHAATCVNTLSTVIVTGYQTVKMVAYPQNNNINIASHGPCGLKIDCEQCIKDREDHPWEEIVQTVRKLL